MLRARTNTGVFILGIDAENLRRLTNGMPILVSLSQMGGTDDVLIMYGDTIDDIKNELERSSGVELPPETILPPRKKAH